MKKTILLLPFLLFFVSPLGARPKPDNIPPHHISPYNDIFYLNSIKTFDEILLLMQKRLSVMHEVARWKWNNGYPVEDLQKEQKLLNRLVNKAISYGIPAEWAESFIQAQIEAAKLIQYHDFEVWGRENEGYFEQVNDLKREILPYLVKLSSEMFEKLAEILPFILDRSYYGSFVPSPLSRRECDAFPPHIWRKAISPFYKHG